MKSNTFYFPHDYNASNDVKCLFLRQQLGMEGYGIFWFLVEQLANSGGRLPLQIVPVLSMQMQVQDVKVLAVIKNFDLFEIDDNEGFFSERLNRHLIERERIRGINSEKGKRSAQLRINHGSTAVQPQFNGGSTKERKGKEIKVKESKVNYPTREQVNEFFKEKGFTGGDRAFDYYDAAGWKDSQGRAVRNWKQKMIAVWFKPENRVQETADRYAGSRRVN